MKPVNYHQMKPTIEYLQDIARIIGRAQQVYVPVDPNFWQAGLEVVPGGLSSQALPRNERIVLDVQAGLVKTSRVSWVLSGLTSTDILMLVQKWLQDQGAPATLKEPELLTDASELDMKQAQVLADMFNFAKQALTDLKAHIHGGVVSPVFVYPHHFDIALSWYPDRRKADETAKERQYTYGFLAGDINISEPYFYVSSYVSSYPDADEIKARPWPEPAHWHTKGFTGAVLKYNQALKSHKPKQLVASFFAAAL